MQAKQLSQKINLRTIFAEASGSAKNVIRLIEKAIKSQKALLALEKDMQSQGTEVDAFQIL